MVKKIQNHPSGKIILTQGAVRVKATPTGFLYFVDRRSE